MHELPCKICGDIVNRKKICEPICVNCSRVQNAKAQLKNRNKNYVHIKEMHPCKWCGEQVLCKSIDKAVCEGCSNIRPLHILKCSVCDKSIERERSRKVAVCFTCKQSRLRLAHKKRKVVV